MTKHLIRQQSITRRLAMRSNVAEGISAQIMSRLVDTVDWSKVGRVHVYRSNPLWNEVSTLDIDEFIAVKAPAAIVTFGEVSVNATVPTEYYDLIIVPLVAFDIHCNRIGFGGGWYDRFLHNQPHAYKVGLAFELQKIEAVPVEPHDEVLDAVITEAHRYLPNKNAPTEVGTHFAGER